MSNKLLEKITQMHEMKFRLAGWATIVFSTAIEVWSQKPSVLVLSPEEEITADEFTWQSILLIILILSLAAAIYWWFSKRKATKKVEVTKKKVIEKNYSGETSTVNASKEREWLRKNYKARGENGTNKTLGRSKFINITTMKKAASDGIGYSPVPLPIFSIDKLEPAKHISKLPLSSDPALISAIEQTLDEFEEDESVRELAVRILNAFKTRNSIEALSQVALYDLSANLRSKAITILSEFDHESVFPTILLACADPTREVRAAAARALTRLSCDRADAWTRIVETEDEGRMVQTARCNRSRYG